MDTKSRHGEFVWHDLLTTDVPAAVAFYADVVGWRTQPFGDPAGPEPYTMWLAGQGPLGGVMALPEKVRQLGAPPHWFANVAVTDLAATLDRVRALGGAVVHGPESVPEIGSFAGVRDPQGAHLSVFAPARDMAPHDPARPGEFAWNELFTSDHLSAFRFYRELFGWEQLRSHDLGPLGEYLIYGARGRTLGGMFTKGSDMPMPSSWIYYIHVVDLDGAVARAQGRGGRLLHGPMDVPGGDRVARLLDPQGAHFALHAPPRA